MPWTIILEDENGHDIEICSHILDFIEFSIDHVSKLKLFKYLLPYGDTTFNEAQIPDLISDLESLKMTSRQQTALDKTIELAQKCLENSHSYLKFYGD